MLDWFKSRTAPKPDASVPAATVPAAVPAAAPPGIPPAVPLAVPAAVVAATVPAAVPAAVPASEAPLSWRDKLRAGLSKTRHAVGLTKLFAKLDDASLEELEAALLRADAGLPATSALLEDLRGRWKRQGGEHGPVAAKTLLKDALTDLLRPLEAPLRLDNRRPFVIMLVGVNGAGKTTSIGKLAKWLQSQNLSVLLAAGDTFRAAAREQLQVWGERNGITVVAQDGGDPAAVIFDAVQAARSRGIDVVLADTAGRLPTQLHLMEELRKIKRVISKTEPGAPHEVLLVLDGNTGQNALAQLQAFDTALGVTGLVLTKLDGTAKGGVVAAIAKTRAIPLRFIGVGEGVDDLRPFDAREFAGALLDE
ncbi:MAG: signal recognition particle-docking protein FtsY [Casimicrobiaceae bacterium]